MILRWRSAKTAWVLLICVGAAAVHFLTRVQELESEMDSLRRQNGVQVARLEEELRAALGQKAAMVRTVRETREEQERQRSEREERRRAANEPMPEGVRLALVAIRECLRADLHSGLRVVRATALEDQSLRGVEVLDYDRDQLISTLYVADRMEMVLDRSSASLALRFFDGHLMRQGERRDFPPGGFELVLPGVNGPMWEARLPYLLDAVESYPEEEESAPQAVLDHLSRRDWQGRLDRLLDEADTPERMRVGDIETLEAGSFGDVLLLGYDEKSLLVMSASAAQMVVRVDDAAGVVQLVLKNGAMRKAGGDTPIGDGGYRILLPGVSPDRARDIMMGMVAER